MVCPLGLLRVNGVIVHFHTYICCKAAVETQKSSKTNMLPVKGSAVGGVTSLCKHRPVYFDDEHCIHFVRYVTYVTYAVQQWINAYR